jgi:hypothetical protein
LRCYFHLVNHHTCIRDNDGLEVPSAEEARLEAFRAIHELLQEEPDAGGEWRGWRLDIAGGDERLILSIPLDLAHQ